MYDDSPLLKTELTRKFVWYTTLALLVLTPISALCDFFDYAVASGSSFPQAADLAVGLTQLLYGLCSLASGAAFLVWFFRAYKNLRLAGLEDLSNPHWAWGSFLVPLYNLWGPYQHLDQLYKGLTEVAKAEPKPNRWVINDSFHLMGWWWAMHIGESVLGNIAFRMNMKAALGAGSASETEVALVYLLGDPFAIAGIVLFYLLFRKCMKMEQAAYDAFHARLYSERIGEEEDTGQHDD